MRRQLASRTLAVVAVLAVVATAAPQARAGMLDLGTANDYSVVALGNGDTIHLNSGPNAGDFLIGNGITAAFSGGGNGSIAGTLFYDNTTLGTNTFNQLQTPPTTQLVNTSVTALAKSEAEAVSLYAQSLTPTQAMASTLTGNGGLNVINFTNFSGGLTLNGTANDVFVFNVSGNYNTNQKMVLNGVDPSHILFNFLGTSGNVFQTAGGDLSYGTYLATRGGNFQFSNLNLNGELINTAGDVAIVSGSKVINHIPFVPEPSSVVLSMIGFGLVGAASLRRRSTTAA